MNRQRLKAQLIEDEGSIPYAYTDSEGYLTIGVGRLIDRVKGGKLSEDEIEYLLDNDIDSKLRDAHTFDWFEDLSDVRQEVIVNMVFNLGVGGLAKFRKMVSALESHDWELASVEMMDSKWARQVGQRAVRLSKAMRTGQWAG